MYCPNLFYDGSIKLQDAMSYFTEDIYFTAANIKQNIVYDIPRTDTDNKISCEMH